MDEIELKENLKQIKTPIQYNSESFNDLQIYGMLARWYGKNYGGSFNWNAKDTGERIYREMFVVSIPDGYGIDSYYFSIKGSPPKGRAVYSKGHRELLLIRGGHMSNSGKDNKLFSNILYEPSQSTPFKVNRIEVSYNDDDTLVSNLDHA